MDYLYCKRNGHGRRRSELIEIISDLDVCRMVCEHEGDRKLRFYVTKKIDGLNTGIRRSEQVHIGASAEAERRQVLSDEGTNRSGYDTESSHETNREAKRAERGAVLDTLKMHIANPNVGVKRNKRLRNSGFQSEDHKNMRRKTWVI